MAKPSNREKPLGFSLLEVMIALALLSFSFTALLLVQGRATRLAAQAKDISVATQLARLQLMECKREAQKRIASLTDFSENGDFSEYGFKDFIWECHAPKFNMVAPSTDQMQSHAKKNAPKGAQNDAGVSSQVASPIMKMVIDSLGDSVRELVVIVRFKSGGADDEIRVVTHITDLSAMSALARVLNHGVETFLKSKPKSGPDTTGQKSGEEK